MKKRIYSSIAIVLILALLFVLKIYVSDYFFDAFFGVLACIACYEMSKLLTRIGFYNYNALAVLFPSVLLAGNLIGVHYAGQTQDLYWILWTILIDIALIFVGFLCAFLFGIFTRKRTLNEMTVRNIKNMSVARFAFKKALNTSICFVYPAFLFLFFIFVNHINILPLEKIAGID